MARYTSDGRFYIKTLNATMVKHDGGAYVNFAKAIPPYVAVNRAWIHMWNTGVDAQPMHQKQQAIVSGRFGNMVNFDEDSSIRNEVDGSGQQGPAAQDKLNGFVEYHLPRQDEDGSPWDNAVTADAGHNVGMVGGPEGGNQGGAFGWNAKGREFMHSEMLFGLGKNAIVTASNQIRYCNEIVKQVNISGRGCNIDMWRLFAIDTMSNNLNDSFYETTDEEDNWMWHVFGSRTPNPVRLRQEAFYLFGNQGVQNIANLNADSTAGDEQATPLGQNMGIDEAQAPFFPGLESNDLGQDFHNWLISNHGFSGDHHNENITDSGLTEGTDILSQTKVTLECKVIKPRIRNIYTPD